MTSWSKLPFKNLIAGGIFFVLLFILLSPFIKFSCSGASVNFYHLSTQSCQEHNLSSAHADPIDLFNSAIPQQTAKLFTVLILIVLATSALMINQRKKIPPNIIFRQKFLQWIWSLPLPFVNQQIFLPYFAPQRDA